MTTYTATAALILSFCGSSGLADMAITEATRTQSIWIDSTGQGTASRLDLIWGYHGSHLEEIRENEAGETVNKAIYESFLSAERIRWNAESYLKTAPGSPGAELLYSRNIADFRFELTTRTTLDLIYFAIDESGLDAASLVLQLRDSGGGYEFDFSTSGEASGTRRLTLDAGVYSLFSETMLNRGDISVAGASHYWTGFTLAVVPTPATLAPFAAAGLLATRRRRS